MFPVSSGKCPAQSQTHACCNNFCTEISQCIVFSSASMARVCFVVLCLLAVEAAQPDDTATVTPEHELLACRLQLQCEKNIYIYIYVYFCCFYRMVSPIIPYLIPLVDVCFVSGHPFYRDLFEQLLRWFRASEHLAELTIWATQWSKLHHAHRVVHVLDLFGVSQQISFLGPMVRQCLVIRWESKNIHRNT